MRRGSERGSGGVVLGLLLELNELLQGGRDGAEEVDVVERMSGVMPPVLENYCRPGRAGARELRSVCQLVDLALARFPAVFRHGQGPELSALWVHLMPHLVEPHLSGETRSRLVHTLRLAGNLYAQGSPGGFHRALVLGFRNLLADLVLATALLPRAGACLAAGPQGSPGGGGAASARSCRGCGAPRALGPVPLRWDGRTGGACPRPVRLGPVGGFMHGGTGAP